MSRFCLLRPGSVYSFTYPRYNYTGLPDRTESRRVRVVSVRDTHREPLDPETTPLNPTLRRGRWLVTGWDLDRDAERSFYAESMRDVRELSSDETEPLIESTGYAVIGPSRRVEFQSSSLSEGLAYLQGRRGGVLCGVLSKFQNFARKLPPRKSAKSRKSRH